MDVNNAKPKNDTGRKVISIFLAFLFSLFFYLSLLCLNFGILTTKGYFKATLKNSTYTALASKELAENLSDLAIPSGLPPDFFKDKIYADYLNRFTNESIDAYYAKNSSYTPNTGELKQKINKDLLSYAEQQGAMLDNDVTKGLENVADSCVNAYLSYSNSTVFRLILQAGAKFSLLLFAASGVLFLIAGLLLLFLRKIHTEKSNFIRYTQYGLFGAALMQLFIPAILLVLGTVKKLGIESESLYSFATRYLSGGLTIALVLGFITLAIGFILFKSNRKTSY